MRLTKVVKVDDARVEALTPEAFRLVLEARGWDVDGEHKGQPVLVSGHQFVPLSEVATSKRQAIELLGREHHGGSTFDAFTEVERVQALLSAVEAAERRELSGYGAMQGFRGAAGEVAALVTSDGCVFIGVTRVARLWPGAGATLDRAPDRAAREARAQLPRLVRIICGVEGG